MAFMNFFKTEDEKEDKKQDNRPTNIGGFDNWEEALKSMVNDQISKHEESMKSAFTEISKDINLNSLTDIEFDKLIIDKATYFEENKKSLEDKYDEKDYDKLIYKFTEDIIKEYK